MTPQRIQRKRTKGWRMPEGAVYVGRPGIYGNPFRVYRCECCGWWDVCDENGVIYRIDHEVTRRWGRAPLAAARDERERRGAVASAVDLFTDDLTVWFGGRIENEPGLAVAIERLRGHDLACWCPLDQPCHADVLLALANGGAA